MADKLTTSNTHANWWQKMTNQLHLMCTWTGDYRWQTNYI